MSSSFQKSFSLELIRVRPGVPKHLEVLTRSLPPTMILHLPQSLVKVCTQIW